MLLILGMMECQDKPMMKDGDVIKLKEENKYYGLDHDRKLEYMNL